MRKFPAKTFVTALAAAGLMAAIAIATPAEAGNWRGGGGGWHGGGRRRSCGPVRFQQAVEAGPHHDGRYGHLAADRQRGVR